MLALALAHALVLQCPSNIVTLFRRAVEAHVIKVKGYQMLYADTYLSEEEFHQMFDHTLYNKVCCSTPAATELI